MKSIMSQRMKKLVDYLENNYKAAKELCGEDDEVNTIPAKKMYEESKLILAFLEQTA